MKNAIIAMFGTYHFLKITVDCTQFELVFIAIMMFAWIFLMLSWIDYKIADAKRKKRKAKRNAERIKQIANARIEVPECRFN